MKIAVLFTPHGLSAPELVGRGVIVLDVLRTTTTVITAVANGAKAVVPAATSEEAVRLTANLEKDGLLLAGERKSLKIDGFALGNSPREMTHEAVSGKTIFLATTNGTPALVAAQGGDPVLVGGVVNFKALVERARAVFAERGEEADLVIVCAGREGEFALEDAYTAGRLVRALKRGTRKLRLNDAAAAAVNLTTHYRDWADALSHSEAARQLAGVDLGDDVAFSSKPDRFSVVPTYADRRIT